jgi:two-component system LytT family response regulator
MITAIIADDEAHARERLRELLGRFEGAFEILAEAGDGNEALQLIVNHKPHVAFLDINMPGISVFQSMASLQHPPLIVFQTAYSEHAARAFEIDALDYLLKPVRLERLEKTVAKIIERLTAAAPEPQKPAETGGTGAAADHVSVTAAGKTRIVAASDIVRISVEEGFCCIYAAGEKLMSDKYLNHFEEKLGNGSFFRTSRTDLVNLRRIAMIQKEYDSSVIVMQDGSRVEVSRRKAQELKRIMDI